MNNFVSSEVVEEYFEDYARLILAVENYAGLFVGDESLDY